MISGVSGANTYQYLTHLRQSHGAGSLANRLFSKIDGNSDLSTSKEALPAPQSASREEPAAFQSTLLDQLQNRPAGGSGTSTTSEASGAASVVSLMQQAVSKYMQLSPAGALAMTGLAGVLATA